MKNWIDNASVLEGLNSLTKFPSIPTLHAMGEKGRLRGDLDPEWEELRKAPFVSTEKVDGTNCRIVVLPDGSFLVGSREEFLWYSRDVVSNPILGIVRTARVELGVASWGESERLEEFVSRSGLDGLVVLYAEAHGGGIGKNGRQYSSIDLTALRVFDVAFWRGWSWYRRICDQSKDEIARRRDAGDTPFLPFESIVAIADKLGLGAPIGRGVPTEFGHGDVHSFLKAQPKSGAILDQDAVGEAEGVVLRSSHGNVEGTSPVRRVKVRFEDYARTLKKW